jgi:hypothetical protein
MRGLSNNTDAELLGKLVKALEKVTPGMEAISNLAGALLEQDARTREANRGENTFDRLRKLAVENARKGNYILPHAPIERQAG